MNSYFTGTDEANTKVTKGKKRSRGEKGLHCLVPELTLRLSSFARFCAGDLFLLYTPIAQQIPRSAWK